MSDTKQYTFKEVEAMTFSQFDGISDPMLLAQQVMFRQYSFGI